MPFLGDTDLILDDLVFGFVDSVILGSNSQSSSNPINVHYSLGYLKFLDVNKTIVGGVICNHIKKKSVISSKLFNPVNFSNNDTSAGIFVNGSENFGNSDTVISEKFI